MEKPIPRSHSHSTHKPHKKSLPTKSLYDDVFGGPPKYGVPVLSPRTEDYAEIFGGFHAPSRAYSGVPLLDLPLADGDELSLDVRGEGFDYSEVFGRGGDGGLLEFEVVSKSDGLGGSSGGDDADDDAWTPEVSDSLSEESEFYDNDHTFSNGDPYMSVDGDRDYKMSFDKVNHRITIFNGVRHTSSIQAVPDYSYVFGENTAIEKKVDSYQSKRQTSDSDLRGGFGKERVKGKQLKKAVSHSSSKYFSGKSKNNDVIHEKRFGRVKSFPAETFVTISEISLKTEPSHLPPPSRPPPALDVKIGDASGSSWMKNSPERDGSPAFFDVEVDGGSATAASAAAMREAMEKAQARLKSAKDMMERRKDCLRPKKLSPKGDANNMTCKGSLFVEPMSGRMDDKVQGDVWRDNNDAESSMREKIKKVSMESRDNLTGEIVREGAVKSVEIEQGEKELTENFQSVRNDKAGGAFEHSDSYNIFIQNEMSDDGDGVRDGSLGKEGFNRQENGRKSKAVGEAQKFDKKESKDKSEMIMNKEKGVSLPEASEGKHLGKYEVIGRHSETKDTGKTQQTAPQHVEHCGINHAVDFKYQEGLDAFDVDVGGFESDIRHASEHDNSSKNSKEFTERTENDEQSEDRWENLLYEKQVIDREEHERGPQTVSQLGVMQNDEMTTTVGDGSLKETLHCSANDGKREDFSEKLQNEERLPDMLDQEKVKVSRVKDYTQERGEFEDILELGESTTGLNMHTLEDRDMTLRGSYEKEVPERRLEEANLQNKEIKGTLYVNKGERAQNWADEQEESERRLVELLEREEMEKMLKNAHLPEDKEKSLSKAYVIEEGEKKLDEAAKLEEIEKDLGEACESSPENGSNLSQERGTIDESLKETYNNIHTDEIPVHGQKKTGVLVNESMVKHEEAVNTFYDDIEWEIVDEGLCEVVDAGERSFVKEACEQIEKDETTGQCCNADGRLDIENSRNPETPTEAIAHQVNRNIVEAEKGVDSAATVELTELTDKKVSRLSGRDLQSKQHGSDFEEIAEAIDNGKCVVGDGIMDSETAGRVYETNCNTSNEEAVTSQEMGKFKDDSKSADSPLLSGTKKEMFTSSQVVNCGFDREKLRDRSLPNLVDGTAQQQNATQSDERKAKNLSKRAIPECRDAERLSREQEAELDHLRKIEEERDREREREKDRMAVDKATLEARERAISEGRERSERAAVERATAEASRRAMMEARERLEKACAEARERSLGEKSAAEARLRLERAAVERAIAEARERAAERAKADRSSSDKVSAPRYTEKRQSLQSANKVSFQDKASESVQVESAQRCRARLERHRRTAERAAKALAEKNMRDLLAQREQAERNRIAETLDADVKRWLSGKEGNLRALLSTLQYILGPDSGWQPIPLTEVITSAAVKKAYRKATLCVHPDKLQQRGASIQQKYICEKVFDLLKEAWNKFNSEER